MRNSVVISCLMLCLLGACSRSPSLIIFPDALKSAPGIVGEVIQDADRYHVQIMYSRINRDSTGIASFETFTFRNQEREYFYPASTVKFPVAVLALEKCRELGVSPETIMITDSSRNFHSPVYQDTSAQSGFPSVAHYIKKVFLVSDNDAFNRLYEFVGPERINRRMAEIGFPDTRIIHRLSISLSRDQNRILNPIHFLSEAGDTLLSLPERIDSLPPPMSGMPLSLGKGEMKSGKLVEEPKDFSEKNRFILSDQHAFFKSVFFSNDVMGDPLKLEPSDREFLKVYMGMLPYQSDWPRYDREYHYDSYVKFFMYGDRTDHMPESIRIYNKVGVAYGWLTDNALIVEEETGIEFLLTATIFINDNQVFNDDTYEYDEIGFPFLAELGRLIYGWEKDGDLILKKNKF